MAAPRLHAHEEIPVIEAVAVESPNMQYAFPSPTVETVPQGVAVYAQPVSEMGYGGDTGPATISDYYEDEEAEMRRNIRANSRSLRRTEYDYEFANTPGGVVVLAERRINPGGLLRLSLACYIWATMSLTMIIIACSWYNREQKEISYEELERREDDGGYTEGGDDDYWEARRRREESEELFEVVYRFFVFIMYFVIICNQRVLLSLQQLHLKPFYEWFTRTWIFAGIAGIIILAILSAQMDDTISEYESGNDDVDWDRFEAQERAHFCVRLTADFIDMFYFLFSGYVFMKTAERIHGAGEED